MSALLKTKPLNASKSTLMSSEFAGVDGARVYYPKSIDSLRGTQLNLAIKGMIAAWNTAQSSKGLISTEGVNIDSSNPEIFEFVLFFWLQRFNMHIASNLFPSFKEINQRELFIRGKVDFNLFEIEEDQEFRGFLCSYSDLSFDFPYFRVLKDGYQEVSKRILSRAQVLNELFSVTCRGLDLLKRVPASQNPVTNALSLETDQMGNPLALPSKINKLTESIKFFHEFIIKQNNGVVSAETELPGFLINLNYLLEFVLRKALRATYENLEVQKRVFLNGTINNISVIKGDGSLANKYMQPDCVGVFSKMRRDLPSEIQTFFENKIYIFDAKHKIFSADDNIQSINRTDFYQIVSYSTTHNNIENRSAIYGLVGLETQTALIEDDRFSQRSYVGLGTEAKSTLIKIESDSVDTSILQIPLRFGQFLYDLGRASEANHEIIYRQLGLNILQAAYDNLNSPV